MIFVVNQIHEVKRQAGSKRVPLDVPADSPLRGRPDGTREPLKEFQARWKEDFGKFRAHEGITKFFRITQGCVIEKGDGTRFQMRNFDKGGAWMKAGWFRYIQRVYRSPLQLPVK